MVKTITDCCAMCQLSRVSNDTPSFEIKRALKQLKAEMLANTEVGITTGGGQTACFTVVSPGEDRLEKKLLALGFKQVHTFARRVGYAKAGPLKMMIKNF
jgi:hypothetical protein